MIYQSRQCFGLPVLFVVKDESKEGQDAVRSFLLLLTVFIFGFKCSITSRENSNLSNK